MITLVVDNDKTETIFNVAAHQIAEILNASGAKPMECLLILGALITEITHENFPPEEHPMVANFFDETLRKVLGDVSPTN